MQNSNLIRETPGLMITGARYAMAERIARRVKNDQPVAADMAGFVAADILDGAILRKFDADTPIRRVADGAVDHMSMVRVAYEAYKKHPASQAYLGILAARAVTVGGANLIHLAKTGEVTKGQNKQRAANLATAAFGLIALTGNKKATHLAGVAAAGVSIATAIPHLRGVGKSTGSRIRKI